MENRENMKEKELLERAGKVRLLVLDVDGVLTDGGIILDDEGVEYKKFHVRDGHGIKLWQRTGGIVGIITGRNSKVVEQRGRELGISHIYQGAYDKTGAYEELLRKTELSDEQVAYMGDDIVDLSLLRRVGFPASVADGVTEARDKAIFVTEARGGRGAVRELVEFLIKAKGQWDELIEAYL